MEPKIVFAAYRPRKGKGNAEALAALVRRHYPTLRSFRLVTARKPVVARAADGTVIEVFEWVSNAAMRRAHDLPAVRAIWGPIEKVATLTYLASVKEFQHRFSHLDPAE